MPINASDFRKISLSRSGKLYPAIQCNYDPSIVVFEDMDADTKKHLMEKCDALKEAGYTGLSVSYASNQSPNREWYLTQNGNLFSIPSNPKGTPKKFEGSGVGMGSTVKGDFVYVRYNDVLNPMIKLDKGVDEKNRYILAEIAVPKHIYILKNKAKFQNEPTLIASAIETERQFNPNSPLLNSTSSFSGKNKNRVNRTIISNNPFGGMNNTNLMDSDLLSKFDLQSDFNGGALEDDFRGGSIAFNGEEQSNTIGGWFKKTFSHGGGKLTTNQANKLADPNKVEYTEQEVQTLYKNSGSNKPLSDWLKNNSKSFLDKLNAIGGVFLTQKGATVATPTSGTDIIGSGLGSTPTQKKILGMHPITFTLVALGLLTATVICVSMYNKKPVKLPVV